MKLITAIMIGSMLFFQSLLALTGPGANTPTLKSKYQTGRVACVPLLTINNDSLPEEQGFKYLTDFAISPNGSIFLLDGNQSKIKMLTESGAFLKSIGQKGTGPGDLWEPLLLIYAGSQIIVWENGGKRFSFFSPTGEFLKIVKVPQTWDVKKMKPLPNGQWLIEREISRRDNQEKKEFLHCQLEMYSPEIQFQATVFKVPVVRFTDLTRPFQIRVFLPFHNDVAWDTTPTGDLVYGFQEHYRVYLQSLKDLKTKPTSFTHQGERVKVTAMDRETVEKTYIMFGDEGEQKPPKAMTQQIPYPQYRPLVGEILVDKENNILVFPYKAFLSENIDYFDAFESSGKFIRRVKLVTPIKHFQKVIFTSTHRLWSLTHDENDEVSLILYELK